MDTCKLVKAVTLVEYIFKISTLDIVLPSPMVVRKVFLLVVFLLVFLAFFRNWCVLCRCFFEYLQNWCFFLGVFWRYLKIDNLYQCFFHNIDFQCTFWCFTFDIFSSISENCVFYDVILLVFFIFDWCFFLVFLVFFSQKQKTKSCLPLPAP